MKGAVRVFASGATRNNDPDRVDWIRMMSLQALFRYAGYMSGHRRQADGNLRDFDNWKGKDGKGGIPKQELVESLVRHVLDLAALDRGVDPMRSCDAQETCCAIIFNAMAYLHTEICQGGEIGSRIDDRFRTNV